MFDYTDNLTVDQFEVPAPKDGNLPETLFEWTEFQVKFSTDLIAILLLIFTSEYLNWSQN